MEGDGGRVGGGLVVVVVVGVWGIILGGVGVEVLK